MCGAGEPRLVGIASNRDVERAWDTTRRQKRVQDDHASLEEAGVCFDGRHSSLPYPSLVMMNNG